MWNGICELGRRCSAERGGENEPNIPAGAGADAGPSPGLRIGPDVPSNREVNFVLSLRESGGYFLGPRGTSD
jgi:hypothetical protein